MGAPMATNVARAGLDVVLYNRTQEKADRLAEEIGATVEESPREAVAEADVIITMLADETALRGVYEGDDGVLAGIRQDAIAVDMGTTGPEGIDRLAGIVQEAGGELVDAPVSGSTAAAESAGLTILVGASDAAFERVQPVLNAMGKAVYHLGGLGAGSVVKLAVNNIIYALGNAVSESLVLAERAGIDRARVYDVFEDSAISAPMVQYRHDAFLDPDNTPAAFALKLAQKDLRLIMGLADSVNAPMSQAQANLDLISDAIAAGLGDRDMADVAVHLRDRAGGGRR